MENCNEVCSPIVPGSKLVKDENGTATDAREYKQMVGCLLYLLSTRPDLAYSVCLVARFMDRLTKLHVTAIKRIMRYLKGTLADGIIKSTSGYVFMLGTSAISWSSKKQPIVGQGMTTLIYCDNNSSIKLSKNHIMHGRCKYIDVRFHFLRNLAKEGNVELKHCTSQEQLADLMTKPLKIDTFQKLRSRLRMIAAQKL
ncbi:copia-type polyprotein [Trifolium pratense]|uniref:Copia-type polyprotein n=1 Tax=Trifolium pratense TaxID=57577 RepID=A0A2K3LSN6_TRIPR|nr:copia-type polyprotein [Trifolium pratense]